MTSKPDLPKPFVFPVMKNTIEELLSKSTVTKDDIQNFQDKYWEQLVPNFSQALKLLDIHGVPRHNILWSINDRLMDAIKSRVDSKSDDNCDQRNCQKLWQKLIKTGIVYIHHPYMRSLIMQVLGKMNFIKERHVNLIVDNKYLYDDAPLPVLRHIWIAHPHKFQEELDKVITAFQNTWSVSILDALSMSIMSSASSTADLVPILYWPPRRRRRDPSVIRIVEMIGEGQILYDKTVNIMRDECIRFEKAAAILAEQQTKISTSSDLEIELPPKRRKHNSSSKDKPIDLPSTANQLNPYVPTAFMPNQPSIASANLCTLRFDLLMSLNEAKIDRLCVPDRIHRFVWCLDACVRNRRIDQRHASELAYHLQLQRRRWARKNSYIDHEINAESVSSDPDYFSDEASSKRSSNQKNKLSKSGNPNSSKSNQKKNNADKQITNLDEKSDSDNLQKSSEANLLESDMHMVCRDPWVIYTISMSLIRYVLHGLYEDKLPRDIPEVNLLVHLLVLGLGNDFYPFYETDSKFKEQVGSKRSSNNSSNQLSSESDNNIPKCPSKALISYILPAVAQLQVLTWRAQVAEEILNSSNNLWPNSDLMSSGNNSSSSQRSTSTSSSHDTREPISPPPSWQKRVKDVTQSTNITIPPSYLAHPIGYLILQYHALFALECNELAVLRALLKAAVNIAQSHTNRSNINKYNLTTQSTTTKSCPDSPPPIKSSVSSSNLPVIFRWRPEILQALVLGISRLPSSAPAFVDTSRNVHNSGVLVESALGDGSNLPDTDDNTSANTNLTRTNSGIPSIIPGSDLGTGGNVHSASKSSGVSVGLPNNSALESYPTNTGSVITRASLASLLRASLPLINDVQLLTLAQIALLVPGPTATITTTSGSNTSSGNTNSSSTGLNADSTTDTNLPTINTLSERERLVNTLSRHCATSVNDSNASETTSVNSLDSLAKSGSYKSSNPRVLAALDVLRKDIDRNLNSVTSPLAPANLAGIKSGSTAYNAFNSQLSSSNSTFVNLSGFQIPDSNWTAPLPRSPLPNKYPRQNSIDSTRTTSPSPASFYSSNRFDFKNMPSSSYYSSSSSSLGLSLPIGTPLTNPGLMAATPSLGNLNMGQNTLPTPRRPPTPPQEFCPPSPSSSNLNNFSVPVKRPRFGSESYITCPSPSVHRSGNSNEIRAPRTPPSSN